MVRRYFIDDLVCVGKGHLCREYDDGQRNDLRDYEEHAGYVERCEVQILNLE
jgi:hypothetical protein